MSVTAPNQSPQPAVSKKQLALIIYILYLIGNFTGITVLIGEQLDRLTVRATDMMELAPVPLALLFDMRTQGVEPAGRKGSICASVRPARWS
jgi:uncharacterized membrane protein